MLVETWAFHLGESAADDLKRVEYDQEDIKAMIDEMMLRDRLLVEGGETVYSRYTGDEPLPLYAFDRRACDRLTTLRALSLLVDEVSVCMCACVCVSVHVCVVTQVRARAGACVCTCGSIRQAKHVCWPWPSPNPKPQP